MGLADILGLVAALAVAAVVIARHPQLATILLVALAARILVMALDVLGVVSVPGSDADAFWFLRRAVEWSALEWGALFAEFTTDEKLYSWLGAVLFKILAPGDILLRSVNICLGILGVYLTYDIAKHLWDVRAAKVAAWIVAVFPFAIFNSVITLRDELTIFLFLLGLLHAVRWVSAKSPVSMIGALVSFSLATFVHPGYMAALVALLIIVVLESVGAATSYRPTASALKSIFSVAIVLAFVALSTTVDMDLGKGLDEPAELFLLQGGGVIEERFSRVATGGSAYPDWVAQGDPYSQPWLIPARIIYFLLSPFPWDISAPRHAFGLIGTVVYLWLCLNMVRSFRRNGYRSEHLAAFLLCAAVVAAFAIGTTNVGTSLRHRVKVLGALAALAVGSIRKGSRMMSSNIPTNEKRPK